MSNTSTYNDSPILLPDEDRLSIGSFAEGISKSIANLDSPVGTTLSINGAWGSGKSSIINLVRHHLKTYSDNEEIVVVDFKCWWFRGEEALTLAFMQELNAVLDKTLGDKINGIIPKISKKLLQTGPLIAPALSAATDGGLSSLLIPKAMDFAEQFFSDEEPIEKVFEQLSEILKKQNKKFLIILDDLDRLTPDELLLMFRLIKSVGFLPNVIYLLAFDREIAEKTVHEKYPSEGAHFLEKIIQASFDAPVPIKTDLNFWVGQVIEEVCSECLKDLDEARFWNLFHDCIAPFIQSPRDIVKLKNNLEFAWVSISRDVNVADFVAIEIIRLLEPDLYRALRNSKDILCKSQGRGNRNNEQEILQGFIDKVSDKNKAYAKDALRRLFPVFENVLYGEDSRLQWEAERLVCTDKHFDTYFRLTIGDDILRQHEIDQIIENAGNVEFIRELLLSASTEIQKNGKSKVPILLEEIKVHADKIPDDQIEPFLTAIFSVADEIYREGDSDTGMLAIGDTYLRIHWLLRKCTLDRFSLDQRSPILIKAIETASLEWLLDFTVSCDRDYKPLEDEQPSAEEKCLVLKAVLPDLIEHACSQTTETAQRDEFIQHPRLGRMLFRWSGLNQDNDAIVKAWMDDHLTTDKNYAYIARAFTSETKSQSGDNYMVKINKKANKKGLAVFADAEAFKNKLEDIQRQNDLPKEQMEHINIFLEAWNAKDDW